MGHCVTILVEQQKNNFSQSGTSTEVGEHCCICHGIAAPLPTLAWQCFSCGKSDSLFKGFHTCGAIKYTVGETPMGNGYDI